MAIVAVTFWFGFGLLAALVAALKGRSFIGWLLIGMLFGLLALVLAIVLPSNYRRPRRMSYAEKRREERRLLRDTKECPECAERVQRNAKVCKHCGHRFDGKAVSA